MGEVEFFDPHKSTDTRKTIENLLNECIPYVKVVNQLFQNIVFVKFPVAVTLTLRVSKSVRRADLTSIAIDWEWKQ